MSSKKSNIQETLGVRKSQNCKLQIISSIKPAILKLYYFPGRWNMAVLFCHIAVCCGPVLGISYADWYMLKGDPLLAFLLQVIWVEMGPKVAMLVQRGQRIHGRLLFTWRTSPITGKIYASFSAAQIARCILGWTRSGAGMISTQIYPSRSTLLPSSRDCCSGQRLYRTVFGDALACFKSCTGSHSPVVGRHNLDPAALRFCFGRTEV